MASHLSVTTSTSGISTTKSFGSSATAESGGEDIFAALLGATGADKSETPAPTAPSKPGSNDVEMSLGFGNDEPVMPEDPELVAAPVDATMPIVPAETPKPKLTELIDGLADLKARLAAGEPLNGEDLAKLDDLLANLAQQLGIDLSKMPNAEQLAALAAAPGATDTLSGKLVEAFGPLAATLLGHTEPNAGADLSAQIKAVGDKLAAILTALNQGEVTPEQLAEADASLATDAELKLALDKLLKPTVAADAAPVLAPPTLEITEKVLTGKATTEAAPPAATTLEVSETEDSTRTKPVDLVAEKAAEPGADKPVDKSADSDKPVDAKPVATAAQAAADKQPDTNAAIQTVPAARVDAVAAPRVVQVGYQTSQQQLNLPQLAFEMARQVSDGNTRFQIRLDPAELGKIDVRLDIDASGQVNARMTVEKAETLDLMQRDQKALERALQQAGLDGSKANLEFSLKQNPFGGGQQGQDGNGRQSLFGGDLVQAEEAPLPTVNLYRGNLSASGVNIVA